MDDRPAICQTSIPIVTVRSRRRIYLGPLLIELRSNDPQFGGFRFFSGQGTLAESAAGQAQWPHFTVTLCDLKIDAPWPVEDLTRLRDGNYRGGRMANGYYLTDHFGRPAYLLTRGADYWLFAEDFTGILWPYVVKYLLTIYSIQHDMLHVKAAAIDLEGRGALLVGRGGSGKTVLLAQLCSSGAAFLSNTHCLICGSSILGVPTSMRVRKDPFFGDIIARRSLAPSVKHGEFVADPHSDLGWPSSASAKLTAICLMDYRGPRTRRIEALDKTVMLEYMDQFALALNVYGLKEDLLDYVGGDVQAFAGVLATMHSKMRSLVEGARCYYMSCDVADERNFREINELLHSD